MISADTPSWYGSFETISDDFSALHSVVHCPARAVAVPYWAIRGGAHPCVRAMSTPWLPHAEWWLQSDVVPDPPLQVTGARIKIGYQAGLKLLRCGATVNSHDYCQSLFPAFLFPPLSPVFFGLGGSCRLRVHTPHLGDRASSTFHAHRNLSGDRDHPVPCRRRAPVRQLRHSFAFRFPPSSSPPRVVLSSSPPRTRRGRGMYSASCMYA